MVATTYSWNVIAATQTDADSPLDETLMEAMRQNLVTLDEWVGDAYTPAKDHDHDGVNSAPATIPAGTVTQAMLKTSQSEISTVSTTVADLTLPGGEYGFYPRIKMNVATLARRLAILLASHDQSGANSSRNGWTSYVTSISMGVSSGTLYAQQRYVTSSGEIYWIFLLREKSTGKIISAYQGPDHPCFGNGGNPEIIRHPFLSIDEAAQEVVVIQGPQDERGRYPAWIEDIRSEGRGSGRDTLQTILEDYEIDDSSSPVWDDREITVGLDHPEPRPGMIVNTIKKPVILAQGLSHRLLKRKA